MCTRAGERQRVGWARRVGRYRRQAFGWRASPLECDAPRALASSRVLRGWGRGEREAQGSVQGPHLRGVSPFLATVPTSVHVHQCTREPHSYSEVVPRTLNSHRSTRGGFQQRSFALWETRPGVCFGTPPAAARPAPLSSRGATCLHTSHDRMGARTVATQRLVSRLAGAVESGVELGVSACVARAAHITTVPARILYPRTHSRTSVFPPAPPGEAAPKTAQPKNLPRPCSLTLPATLAWGGRRPAARVANGVVARPRRRRHRPHRNHHVAAVAAARRCTHTRPSSPRAVAAAARVLRDVRRCKKLRIVRLGFGAARQETVLERWTNPKPPQPVWDRAAI